MCLLPIKPDIETNNNGKTVQVRHRGSICDRQNGVLNPLRVLWEVYETLTTDEYMANISDIWGRLQRDDSPEYKAYIKVEA